MLEDTLGDSVTLRIIQISNLTGVVGGGQYKTINSHLFLNVYSVALKAWTAKRLKMLSLVTSLAAELLHSKIYHCLLSYTADAIFA
jgi:hypothetical protein